MDPSCDPRHQRVVPNSIKERVEIQINAPRRTISDGLACPLDRFMRRAPRAKPEAAGMETRVKDRREHLRHGLLDQPIQHRRHPQHPHPARRLSDHHPPDRRRPVDARVKLRADLRPMVFKPRPQLPSTHPVDASGTGVSLDTSERLSEIAAGEHQLPQPRLGGVSDGVTRRRVAAALWTSTIGLHPPALPPRPPKQGLAAVNATTTSTNVLTLGSAFGPPRRTINPAGTTTSADFSTASSSLPATTVAPTRRSAHKRRSGIKRHPQRPPGIRPATFLAHPPHSHDGPLMTSGFAITCWLARTAPPPMRFVYLGSRFRLRPPSHPASQRRSCPRLVIGAINPHRGLPPPND